MKVELVQKHERTHSFQTNGKHLYFAAEIQAWLWSAREFSAVTAQSGIQKPNSKAVKHQERLTHVCMHHQKPWNWAYSWLENKWTAKHVQKYLSSFKKLFFGDARIFTCWNQLTVEHLMVVLLRTIHTYLLSMLSFFCCHSLGEGVFPLCSNHFKHVSVIVQYGDQLTVTRQMGNHS